MKTFYVHQKQLPLILAYAVIFIKYLGLSLVSVIVDYLVSRIGMSL